MTDIQIKELINILEKEHKLYQKIYKLGEEKRQVIINQNIENLNIITNKEELLLDEISNLEEKRLRIAGEKSISELSDNTEYNYRKLLTDMKSKLEVIIEKLSELNELNSQLIKDSLQMTTFSINLLTNNSKQGTYGKKGYAKNDKNHNSIINHKA